MAQKIIMKKSTVPGRVPGTEDLQVGELAVNTADGRLFSKHADGAVVPLGAAPEASGGGAGSVEAVASGALEDGSVVVLNGDGTVSVAGSSVSVAVSASGTDRVLDVQCAFDEGTGKLVVIYARSGETEVECNGFAVVGTVAGGSITFGTPVMYDSGVEISAYDTGNINIIYLPASGKVVITFYTLDWESWDEIMKCVVGTVTGTIITFGALTVIKERAYPHPLSSAYRPATGQAIIAFDYEGSVFMYVGDIAGTTISFGPNASGAWQLQNADVTYDIHNDRLITAYEVWYEYDNNKQWCAVRVGSISGNVLALGALVPCAASTDGEYMCCYDQQAGKSIIVYRSRAGSWTAVAGTTSGASMTFGPACVLPDQNKPLDLAYCPAAGKVALSNKMKIFFITVTGDTLSFNEACSCVSVVSSPLDVAFSTGSATMVRAYVDPVSKLAKAIAGTVTEGGISFESTNITAENFLGISSGACAGGATATVATAGAAAANMAGLTTARRHYLQSDGSLGVVPADPEVYAGLALSSTTLLVKG